MIHDNPYSSDENNGSLIVIIPAMVIVILVFVAACRSEYNAIDCEINDKCETVEVCGSEGG